MTSVAAIDCGTHSIRLLIAEPNPNGPGLIDVVRRTEIVRLGQGVDRTGRLSAAALGRAEETLTAYAQQLARLGVDRVRMVATSAARDAENADEFRSMARVVLGVDPEVISGEEEARLTFAGAATDLPGELPQPVLVVDIGGGSTEFVVGFPGEPPAAGSAVSVDVGCVRMTERHLRGDPPTAREIAVAETAIVAEVDRALAAVRAGTARTLIGLAGSVTTVTAIALGLDKYRPEHIHQARVAYPAIARVTAGLLSATRTQRLAMPVMHPARAPVIGAGALIARVILDRGGFAEIVASEHDILDGIARSLA
ncbi:MAG: Ppx/GppA family phosphatase [Dactylosporangium sp.]|nr:Ppx/GppA family phosphatase [Dactylosporangium sp.]NNJ63702.1 Ppx/GppA family phosphatase [Dactylosporangium sp.]